MVMFVSVKKKIIKSWIYRNYLSVALCTYETGLHAVQICLHVKIFMSSIETGSSQQWWQTVELLKKKTQKKNSIPQLQMI